MATSPLHHGEAFSRAVAFVIYLEGGSKLTDDPDDAGGETRFGISKRANPDIDIRSLTRDRAVQLYYERYWVPCYGDNLPPPLALGVFAAFVHMNPREAAKILQRAIGTVRIDGALGSKTLGAARRYKPQSELRARFSRAWFEWYVQHSERYPYTRKWIHGWIGRVTRVADMMGRWGSEYDS